MISFPTILLRLGLALVLGAIVGFERETHEHPAGVRTVALVSLGSSLFTIISAFGFMDLLSIPHVQLDPTRIASYIVAGIGFLGAGSIFFSQGKNNVKGLTTAATIWIVAAIGMACGAGQLLEAIATTFMTLVILIGLRYIEEWLLPRKSSNVHHLHIEASSAAGPFIGKVYDTCTKNGLTVETLKIHSEQDTKTVEISCHVPDAALLVHAISELSAFPEVRAVQTDLQIANIKNPQALHSSR